MQRQQPGLLLLLWCVALVCACMDRAHARTQVAYAMGQMLREDSCTPIGTSLSPQEACSFVHDHCAHTSIYPYLSLYYCASARVQTLSVSHVLVGLVSLMFVLWLLVLFSVLGIYLASTIPNLSSLHLDFSIVAVLVAIIVSFIKNWISLLGVLTTIISSLCLTALHIEAAILFSGMLGMGVAVYMERWERKA